MKGSLVFLTFACLAHCLAVSKQAVLDPVTDLESMLSAADPQASDPFALLALDTKLSLPAGSVQKEGFCGSFVGKQVAFMFVSSNSPPADCAAKTEAANDDFFVFLGVHCFRLMAPAGDCAAGGWRTAPAGVFTTIRQRGGGVSGTWTSKLGYCQNIGGLFPKSSIQHIAGNVANEHACAALTGAGKDFLIFEPAAGTRSCFKYVEQVSNKCANWVNHNMVTSFLHSGSPAPLTKSPTVSTKSPTVSTKSPTQAPATACNLLSAQDVIKLDAQLEIQFKLKPERAPQFLRIAFHEAGSWSASAKVGGTTGCLLNHAATQNEKEHGGLEKGDLARQGDALGPIEALKTAKATFNTQNGKCISSADITQYCGIWAAHRQAQLAAIKSKLAASKAIFRWGRKDLAVASCKAEWVHNLPGFEVVGNGFAARMAASAIEIKKKMVTGNGFTVKQAVALTGGAHSIGKIRSQDFSSLAGPWVTGGDTNGGDFGIKFFEFGKSVAADVVNGNIQTGSGKSFQTIFSTHWFGSMQRDRAWLDTDVCLVSDPNFAAFSKEFADSPESFVTSFVQGMELMREFGATR
jgi:hypothetical protein